MPLPSLHAAASFFKPQLHNAEWKTCSISVALKASDFYKWEFLFQFANHLITSAWFVHICIWFFQLRSLISQVRCTWEFWVSVTYFNICLYISSTFSSNSKLYVKCLYWLNQCNLYYLILHQKSKWIILRSRMSVYNTT